MPVPDIVSEPEPRLRPVTSMVTSPAPPTVRFLLVLVTPPVRVSLPAVATTFVASANVIAPASVLLPEKLRRAPLPEMPVPVSEMASAATVMPPWTRSSAPSATVVPAAAVPRAVSWPMARTPQLTVVAPA